MTQEQKDLLLKDLSARLVYGVKAYIKNWSKLDRKYYEGVYTVKSAFPSLNEVHVQSETSSVNVIVGYDDYEIKPYLFPLSSMTEEQREELYKIGWYLDEDKIYSCFRNYDDVNYKTHTDCFELINWCYKNKFDINGLIPMGLANDATGLNIY